MALLPLTEVFYTLIIAIIIFPVLAGYGAQAQQLYSGDAEPEAACNSTDNNNSNAGCGSFLGYYCNGPASCKTTLTIRSRYPYNTLSTIASLLNVDTDDISQANPHCSIYDDVEWSKLVYVPVTCSNDPSVSPYYLKSTSYTVGPADTYFHLANDTYQGLVTCQAIRFMNRIDQDPSNWAIGKSLTIPLRCACPTRNQQNKGIASLLTYVVEEGDTISSISTEFMVFTKSILEANTLSEDSVIYPFTTLLIPLTAKEGKYDGSSSSSNSLRTKKKKTILERSYVKIPIIGITATISVSITVTLAIRCNIKIIYRTMEKMQAAKEQRRRERDSQAAKEHEKKKEDSKFSMHVTNVVFCPGSFDTGPPVQDCCCPGRFDTGPPVQDCCCPGRFDTGPTV